MMKKTYMRPAMEVILLGMRSQILAGSADINASEVGLSSTTVDNNDAYGRGNSFWDEDED